jgi:putative peptidoglycan lipid II flippase
MTSTVRNLAAASLIVMAGFVASRILGLVRNMVILSQFGAGREYEAFLAAIAIPDLVFQVLAGGAVGSAFIPVFKGYFARGEDAAGWRLTNSVMTIAVLATLPTAALLSLLARPVVVPLIVPGWDSASRELTAQLMQIMLISPVVFAVSGFVTSVLNSFQRFAWAALAPVIYNLAIIVAALLARPVGLGIQAVALGVTVGAGLHLLIQIPSLLAQGFRPRPRLDWRSSGVREVSRLVMPRMLGLAVVQLNLLVNVVLASFLMVGSLGYLNVAWLLIMSPLVLAMSISTAVFPTLAEESALERRDEVRRLFLLSLRLILFVTVPASVGLIALGEPIVELFFERGAFDAESTRLTAYALRFYALGLAGHAAVEIVTRVFYAFHDTWTPVRVAIGAIALNLVLSLVLMQTPLNFGGLALASSLAALIEGGMLLWLLSLRFQRQDGESLELANLGRWLGRVASAALIMGLVLVLARDWLQLHLASESILGHTLILLTGIAFGAALYVLLTTALRLPEPATLRSLLRR